jgi:hypothetical protein
VSDAWQSIKIRQFEHVGTGSDTSLLRVSGKSPWRRATSTRPLLRVDRHGDAHRFAALPAPDDPRGSLRAAYSIPSGFVTADSKFWLEHADGSLTQLPPPVAGAGRSGADPAADADDPTETPESLHHDAQRGELPEIERRSDLLTKLAEQSGELARAERENEELRDTIRELEIWRGELERRLAAISSELGVAKAAREADERELKRLREALAEAEARSDRDGHSTDASQTLDAQAAEIELLVAELASVRAEQSNPESAGSARLSEQVSARIVRLEAERAELARRAERLDAALKAALDPAQALLELARAGLDEPQGTAAEGGVPDADAQLIALAAERTAREQAERELREATRESSRGRSTG